MDVRKSYLGEDGEVIIESLLESPTLVRSAWLHNWQPMKLDRIRHRIDSSRRGSEAAKATVEALRKVRFSD